MNSKQNLAVSQQQKIQSIQFLQMLHRKGQNKICSQFSLLGQEPTFNGKPKFMLVDKMKR